MKLIEFVDAGNYGRSPIAEVVGNDYLQEQRLDLDWKVISSGFDVDNINARGNGEDQDEKLKRDRMLEMLSLVGRIKILSEQTIARPDVEIMVCLDKRSYCGVLWIYSNTWFCPTVCLLSRIAVGSGLIENAYGKDFVVYEQSIRKMCSEIPLALARIIGG